MICMNTSKSKISLFNSPRTGSLKFNSLQCLHLSIDHILNLGLEIREFPNENLLYATKIVIRVNRAIGHSLLIALSANHHITVFFGFPPYHFDRLQYIVKLITCFVCNVKLRDYIFPFPNACSKYTVHGYLKFTLLIYL